MRLVLSLLAALTIARGQSAGLAGRDPDALLQQARARLQAMARRMENYVCIETVDRSYYRRVRPVDAPPPAEAPPACSQGPLASSAVRNPRQLESTDRVRLEVTVSQGRELHSWPGATRFDTRDVDELIRDGPVSTGSFGAYLTSVFDHAGVTYQYNGERAGQDHTVLEYRYRVPADASRFDVKVEGVWKSVAYEGEFWLNPQSLDLERLTIRANSIPPNAAFCEASSTLDYQYVRIGDGDVLLPRRSQLEIVQKSARETSNVTTFASCREYHAESEVSFDLPADPAAAAPRTGRGRVALPIGLPVTLALDGAIDTDTASAGDPVSAKVVKAVRRPGSNEDLIPAGAVVRGRIRRVEHHLLPQPYFLISLAFNRVEMQGVVAPFMARSEANPDLARDLNANLAMRDTGIWFWGVGTFLFPSAKPHYVVPAGFESKWFTLDTGGR